MDFHHLQAIVTVADERSFTHAAKRLFVSQPSLSQLVRRLEAEIGTELFDRSAQPIKLTKAGQIFLPRARRLLDDYAGTLTDIRRTNEQIEITVGATPLLGNIVFPDLINQVRQLELSFSINPVESSSSELEDLIEQGVIDFAVMSHRSETALLRYEAVVSNGYRAAMPNNTEMPVNDGRVRAMDVLSNPLLLPKAGGVRSSLDAFFERIGVEPVVAYESGSTDTMLGLVEAGFGFALVPEIFITREVTARHPRALFMQMDIEPPRLALGIASRHGETTSTAMATAMEITRNSLRKLFPNAHDVK